MKKARRGTTDAALLRHRAEDRIRMSRARKIESPGTAVTAQELIYELQVHQIELEMQNEELMKSRAEAEAGLEHYSELYNSAPVAYFTLAPDSMILQVNQTGMKLFGMERAQLVNRRFGLFVSELDRPVFNAFLTKAFESRVEESCEVALCNNIYLFPSFQSSGVRTIGNAGLRILQIEGVVGTNQACRIVAIDITERKRIEDELEDSVRVRTSELQTRAEQLRALASELTHAEIRARKHLASVLHDDLQQLLVCMKLSVSSALTQTEKAKADTFLKDVEDLLKQSIDKCRTLTADISPMILAHGSLVDALRWLGRWMHERYGLNVDLQIKENTDTTQDVRALLFLAVRELLFNIVKHSGVNHAVVRVDRSSEDSLSISVTDKGKGFASSPRNEPGQNATSFGLLSIQERLQYLGGRFEIFSAPGLGTTMQICAPIGRESEKNPHLVGRPEHNSQR